MSIEPHESDSQPPNVQNSLDPLLALLVAILAGVTVGRWQGIAEGLATFTAVVELLTMAGRDR